MGILEIIDVIYDSLLDAPYILKRVVSLRFLTSFFKYKSRAPRLPINVSRLVQPVELQSAVESEFVYTSETYSDTTPCTHSENARVFTGAPRGLSRCSQWVSEHGSVHSLAESRDSAYHTSNIYQSSPNLLKGSFHSLNINQHGMRPFDSVSNITVEEDRMKNLELELEKMRAQLSKLVLQQESALTPAKVAVSVTAPPPPPPPLPPPPPPPPSSAFNWREQLIKSRKKSANGETPVSTPTKQASMHDVLQELRSGNIKLKPVTPKPQLSPTAFSSRKTLTPQEIIENAIKARFKKFNFSQDSDKENSSEFERSRSPNRLF